MKDSHIQWTDHTFNPWEGCAKVSPGCANCYAEARNARFGGGKAPNWGPGAPRRRTVESNWNEPKKWNREAMERQNDFNENMLGLGTPEPRRPRVFCASLADWLDDEVEISWLADLLTLVFDCGFLDWQMLTKRPQNFFPRVKTAAAWIRNHKEPSERNAAIVAWLEAWLAGTPPDNVWIGTTVEDQARADERVPLLLAIPAAIRFLSCEPILGRVNLASCAPSTLNGDESNPSTTNAFTGFSHNPKTCLIPAPTKGTPSGVSWVIVGGESGNKARHTDVDAIESVISQCRDAKVSCFVKQLGARPFSSSPPGNGIPSGQVQLNPKAMVWSACWRLKHGKGGDPAEWPERFRVQSFPKVSK